MIEDVVGAKNKNFIQTSLVSLETPGKATVSVVILRDPVCFIFLIFYRFEVQKRTLKNFLKIFQK